MVGSQAPLQQPVRMVVPTVLRARKGRPRRLAPDAVPADSSSSSTAASSKSGAGLGSSASATLVAAAPRRAAPAALPAFKSTATVPRSLTSPLPPLAEVPSWLLDVSKRVALATIRGSAAAVRWTASATMSAIRNPAAAKANAAEIWQMIKEEAHHYWVGSKLLVAEVRTSSTLLRRVGRGETLTRRERLQLKRTVGDLLRMVPFVVIVIIPFAELSLPVLLKLFPNMLPSQFEKAEFRQEVYRKSLNARLELHQLLQEVLQERVARRAAAADGDASADAAGAEGAGSSADAGNSTAGADAGAGNASSGEVSLESLMAELDAVRTGRALPPATVVKVAQLFRDEITVDNLPRGQLAALAKFAGLSPFAPEPLLRLQLRLKMRAIREDDRDLAEEGTDGLSTSELQAACEARGMRAVGLNEAALRVQLNEWLALSVTHRVPLTLLLLSRAFQIAEGAQPAAAPEKAPTAAAAAPAAAAGAKPAVLATAPVAADGAIVPAATPSPVSSSAQKALQESISTLDETVLKEALLAAATGPGGVAASGAGAGASATARTAVMELKLESIEAQNALIAAEREAMDSMKAAEKAESEAAAKTAAAAAASSDPSLKAAEIASLEAEASAARSRAAEKAAIAAAKRDTVLRMRAKDAATAALEVAAHRDSAKADVAAAVAAKSDAAAAAGAAAAAPATSAAVVAEMPLDAQATAATLKSIAADATLARERELLANIKRAAKTIAATEALARGRIEPSEDASAAAAVSTAAASAAAETPAAAEAAAAADAAEAAAVAAEDAGTAFLRRRLDAMLAGMEAEVELLADKRDLRAALSKVDVNRDGRVTLQELEAALRSYLAESGASGAAALSAVAGGGASAGPAGSAVAGSASGADAATSASAGAKPDPAAAAAALMRLLDADRDGSVSVETLNRFIVEFAERSERSARKAAAAGAASGAPAASAGAAGSASAPAAASGSANGGAGAGSGSSRRTGRADESDSESEESASRRR